MQLVGTILSFFLLVHGWYPEECCETKHCYPVEWVNETPDGNITVKTDDGLKVTVPRDVPKKVSLDGEYHLCFRKESFRIYHQLEIFCFFVPGLV